MNTPNPSPANRPTPLQRDFVRQRRLDENGNYVEELISTRVLSEAADGCIDREECLYESFYHCGHGRHQPLGGKCAEPGCFNISCHQCFRRCHFCNVGLCLYHARQVAKDGQMVVACPHCRSGFQRREFWRKLGRSLLRPFISFNQEEK